MVPVIGAQVIAVSTSMGGRVTGEHADRSASRWRTKVSPDDLASGYHSGAV